MLLKYSGISFISGAVNHGFFSGERSLWTAVAGILLFVAGALMLHRLEDDTGPREGLWKTLLLGALLSVGLGFFTGGLQHFPDSPARSAWVVPLGYAISVPALALSTSGTWRRSSTLYSLVAGVLITIGSYATWQWLEHNPQFLGGHAHGALEGASTEGHGAGAASTGMTAMRVDRSIDIRMGDDMRFSPNQIEVKAGETLRLRVYNDGKLPHELVLGTDEEIRQHAEDMKKGAAHGSHGHGRGAAIEVAPGQSGELVVQFAQAATLQMACLIPGHYEGGMRGKIQVTAGASASSGQGKSSPSVHDHSSHKH
jgi:uncharacterized cupredoxin-like copper-binding protein